ncbi:MAG: NAD(+) diphosphatase [Methanoregula sp.]|jgi:NAD+ diphosphatase
MTHHAVFATDTLVSCFPEPEYDEKTGRDWIVVSGAGVAVRPGNPPQIVFGSDPEDAGFPIANVRYLGIHGKRSCYAAELKPSAPVPAGWEIRNVRELFTRLLPEDLALASFAVRIADFFTTSRFCGRCGYPTEPVLIERAVKCPSCGLILYPRISPAIIVLITNGDRILLARSPHFPPDMHSIIAGFVEAGETLEHAVQREIHEEVGISVKNIRYFGSEPWPFPNSLMIGFTAEYDSGRIAIDNHEIVSAGWYGRDNLPPLPSPMSISRDLIDRWKTNGSGFTAFLQGADSGKENAIRSGSVLL